MYLGTYNKFRCNKCEAINWIYEGDLNDMTQQDTDGFECWNCGFQEYLGDEEWKGVQGEENIYYKTGNKEPE